MPTRTGVLLGFDGGGTKTTGVLVADDGRVLARARAGRSAIVGSPHPEAAALLRRVCQELCVPAGVTTAAIAAAGVGLSGIDFADEHTAQVTGVAAALELPTARLRLVNDAIPSLWGATAAPAAAIIQHGTAFTAAWRARPGGETLFDHLDTGRQFDLRAQLPVAVSRMLDGRLPPTPLLDAALAHYGVTDRTSFSELLYRGRLPADRLVTSIPVITAAWAAGDPVATELVTRAAEDYACTAAALLAKVGTRTADLALGGGLFRVAGTAFRDLVAARVRAACPGANVVSPRLPPECGAVLMAAVHAGWPAAPLWTALAAQVPTDWEGQP